MLQGHILTCHLWPTWKVDHLWTSPLCKALDSLLPLHLTVEEVQFGVGQHLAGSASTWLTRMGEYSV